MKLLYYGESPLNPTGFGHVNKHILAACAQVCDVTHVATTHYVESYNHEEYPYTIVGCPPTPVHERTMENQRNLPTIKRHLEDLEAWDIFFYQGDMGWNNDVLSWVKEIVEEHPEKRAIFYMPVDGDISHGAAFTPLSWCNAPVVYTTHAKGVIEKYAPEIAKSTSVIWLGCDTDTFYPLTQEGKRAARVRIFGEEYVDRFLLVNVNRNQVRKDLARCMAAFHQFHKKYGDSSLYMHSVMMDAGGSLPSQAIMAGCDVMKRPSEIIFSNLDLANPWPRSTLNDVYNACDVLVSTAYGEGWGLATSEAMSAGTTVLVPQNTSNFDIVGEHEERGYFIKSGGDLDHITFLYQNGASIASVIHADSFLTKLAHIYHNRDEAREKAKLAREWCEANTWKHRQEEWKQLLRLFTNQQESSLQITTT